MVTDQTHRTKFHFFAAMRGSDMVRSTGWCQFSKNSQPGSVLGQQKEVVMTWAVVRGGGLIYCLRFMTYRHFIDQVQFSAYLLFTRSYAPS